MRDDSRPNTSPYESSPNEHAAPVDRVQARGRALEPDLARETYSMRFDEKLRNTKNHEEHEVAKVKDHVQPRQDHNDQIQIAPWLLQKSGIRMSET